MIKERKDKEEGRRNLVVPQGNTTHRNDAQLEQKKRDGERLFAPPGFAPLFPELSGIERNMAL